MSLWVSTKSLLLCVGLAVGIGLACIVWVGYTLETNVRTTDHDKSSTASYNTDRACFGLPYAIIDRELFGDPVLSIMDVSLFHPLLLYRGNVLQGDMGWGWRCRWRWIHRLVGRGSNKDDDRSDGDGDIRITCLGPS